MEVGEITHTVVPVTCAECGADMTFTCERLAPERRKWAFHCTACGNNEDSQEQVVHHLWANDNTIYVGSYWGPPNEPLAREADDA